MQAVEPCSLFLSCGTLGVDVVTTTDSRLRLLQGGRKEDGDMEENRLSFKELADENVTLRMCGLHPPSASVVTHASGVVDFFWWSGAKERRP